MTGHWDDERKEVELAEMRLRTEALRLATDAAVQMLSNPETPPTAKASVINTIFRATGVHSRAVDPIEKPLHEMSLAELRDMQAKAARELQIMDAAAEQLEPGEGIFG